MKEKPYGYTGYMLRVDLSTKRVTSEEIDDSTRRAYVGGVGFGAKFMYEEVPPGVAWNDSRNRIILASGPVAGTRVSGSGLFCVVTKGPMTNLAVSSQANGFLGAYLKYAGFDGIIIQGRADEPCYLYVHHGQGELRSASYLKGKDTWETGEEIRKELGLSKGRLSVYGIGVAGENLVRFACLVGDDGHVAAHGGIGAVFGAKNLKAVAVAPSKEAPLIYNNELLAKLASDLLRLVLQSSGGSTIHKWGTAGLALAAYESGVLPIKNYTTSIFPDCEKISGQFMRTKFEHRPKPCWACRIQHLTYMKVTEGPCKGFEGEEPEYEDVAAFGSQIGNADAGSVVMLTNLADKLGLDANESGWVTGWAMECYEKGLLTNGDLDALEMKWGNVQAAANLLQKIAHREGVGNMLAEGVKRASEKVGGEAPKLGVYTQKGSAPRGHDHRARWAEMLDTCMSNTSTVEATAGVGAPGWGYGVLKDPFSAEEVSRFVAEFNGWHQFEDCVCVCRFNVRENSKLLIDMVNAITGWNMALEDAMNVGRRVVNQLRVFNLRHGLDPDCERPSPRYGSTPSDGPARGIAVMKHWDEMVRDYRKRMGWDEQTGKPREETLRRLGLEGLIHDLPP